VAAACLTLVVTFVKQEVYVCAHAFAVVHISLEANAMESHRVAASSRAVPEVGAKRM
jgi:hypothetical protein